MPLSIYLFICLFIYLFYSDENVLDYLVSQCQTVEELKNATKPFLGAR